MVGRTRAPNRDARTSCARATAAVGAGWAASGYPLRMPVNRAPFVLLLALAIWLAACSSAPAPSFDPTGACTADGRAPGAYPDLEARIPGRFFDSSPATLDSGRNCSAPSLGSLAADAFTEIRFAGGTWTFGAERAAVLAVFSATGLDADELADFYAESAHAANRTEVLAEAALTIVGRTGRRLDTKTGERLQTVVVWPAAEAGMVNVVITNDLPDARITEAIDAFGER